MNDKCPFLNDMTADVDCVDCKYFNDKWGNCTYKPKEWEDPE